MVDLRGDISITDDLAFAKSYSVLLRSLDTTKMTMEVLNMNLFLVAENHRKPMC